VLVLGPQNAGALFCRRLQRRPGSFIESAAAALDHTAMVEEAEYHFYSALCRAASCDSTTPDERVQHLEALATHHRQLEIWVEN
jgi:hypothetical protein